MTLKLKPADDLKAALTQFLKTNDLNIELTDQPENAITVETKPKQPSTLTTLYAQGRISCQMAWTIAGDYDITVKQFGQLLEHLNIKITNCSLGCF
jgi:hypothetical protein